MTHKMRSTLVVPTPRAGVAIAGAILSAAIISGGLAATAEAQEGAPSAMPPLIYSPSAKFCVKSSELGGKEVCFTGSGNILQEANEGPPTDPNVFEEQQKKLQADLQKRADEIRKKLESQSGTGPSAPLRKGPGLLPPCLPNCRAARQEAANRTGSCCANGC
jgi:hypothetical protein